MTGIARLAALAFTCATAHAMGPMRPPPFLDQLFPPRLVMRNQQEIGLTDAQRKAITQAIGEAQQRLVELQWTLDAESEAMGKLLEVDPVDETAALAQSDKVVAIEDRIKREHLRLLVRIKNELTPEQEHRLRELRPRRPRRAPPED
jgi:Spy/CpxP family protein refolding chaperone